MNSLMRSKRLNNKMRWLKVFQTYTLSSFTSFKIFNFVVEWWESWIWKRKGLKSSSDEDMISLYEDYLENYFVWMFLTMIALLDN